LSFLKNVIINFHTVCRPLSHLDRKGNYDTASFVGMNVKNLLSLFLKLKPFLGKEV
jgi:hypothetical protein